MDGVNLRVPSNLEAVTFTTVLVPIETVTMVTKVTTEVQVIPEVAGEIAWNLYKTLLHEAVINAGTWWQYLYPC